MALRVSLGLILALCVTTACGGSQAPEETTPSPAETTAPAPSKEERDQAKLAEAQKVGCEGYCERATSCAVEDAEKNLSAKELEELNLAETTPIFRQKCLDECGGSQLSVRQVEVMHKCLSQDGSTCEQFATCMEAMNPPDSAASP